jgi:hypothetical protein
MVRLTLKLDNEEKYNKEYRGEDPTLHRYSMSDVLFLSQEKKLMSDFRD